MAQPARGVAVVGRDEEGQHEEAVGRQAPPSEAEEEGRVAPAAVGQQEEYREEAH